MINVNGIQVLEASELTNDIVLIVRYVYRRHTQLL